MDSVDISAVTSTGGYKRRVNKKNRHWHKQLHLRKSAVQPPTMQSEDKHGLKKIVEEWEPSTTWPSSKKHEAQQSQERTNDSGNTLRFTCSQCSDGLEYDPKDLVRHFEEKHRGSTPVFSCHMCTFSTHEFSYLQVHLLSHKDTFSSCSICNDNVQRTWSEFSAHLTMYHCHNGKYSCEMCQEFSTGDDKIFLEHIYAHSLGLEGANDDLWLPTFRNKFGPKTTTQALRCKHCGFEASQKWLITKHMKAVHVCSNGNQRKKKKKVVHSIAMKPNDPIPKIKPRLTRSAVREMCWLTQDCLSLPGREFLDKYCHLSDPQTTLEETKEFLRKSVAGETGDQQWTKALKTVLSNVPQDVSLHPKSENGVILTSSDLTVLTVKNQITVAQNGATYAKKLKMMTSLDKDTVSPESAADDASCVVDQNGCQSDLNGHAPCPQAETKLNNVSAQNEPCEVTQMQENRENQELKTDQEIEEHGKTREEPVHEDGIAISNEFKLTNESKEQTLFHKVVPKNRRQNRRRKRKSRFKKVDKSAGLALKLVLKKNPVKQKQWVSQSSSSPSGGGLTEDFRGLPSPHTALDETPQIVHNTLLAEGRQEKWTKASKTDLHNPAETIASMPQSQPREVTPGCATQPVGSKNLDGNMPVVIENLLPVDQEMRGDTEKSSQVLETEADASGSADRTGQLNSMASAVTEVEEGSEKEQLQTSGSDAGCRVSDDMMSSAANGKSPLSSYTKSTPVSQPVITPQGKKTSEDLSLDVSSEHSTDRIKGGEMPADCCPDQPRNTILPSVKPVQQELPAAFGHHNQLVPKNRARTLKLVAISPSQLVKRPAGDQPVVVLNHPDADIPEVARIMEVINRYNGEVQKVILSRRTANALSAINGEVPNTTDPTDAKSDSSGHTKSSVRERFMLKLKLRRLSRKKYEVVEADSPSRDAETKFRCWFCGRAFACQETCMVHRQRHLMEFKRPNCEYS